MYFSSQSIFIIIFITITVAANVEIKTEKNDSCENKLNESSIAIENFSICNFTRTLNDSDWPQTEDNATLLSNILNSNDEKVTPTESTNNNGKDNFEDLEGRISKQTLDLIRKLHMHYLNMETSIRQPESSISDVNKSKNEEIVHISGKLEIL